MRGMLRVAAMLAACGISSLAAAQPKDATAQELWKWEQEQRATARTVYTAENPDPAKVREAIASLEKLTEWLKSEQAHEAAKEITWLPYQAGDIALDLAVAHAAIGQFDEAARMIDRLVTLIDSADIPTRPSFYVSVMERTPQFAKARDHPAVRDALARMKAKDPWARFTTDSLSLPDKSELSSAERVMGLTLFWSEAKYNFAYFDRLPNLDWNKTLLDYLPRAAADQSMFDYYRLLQEMCALLKDSHTNVYLPPALAEAHEARPPIRTELAENRVFITKLFSPGLEAAGLRPGQEIVTIDGVPVVPYAKRREKLASASTPQDMDVRLFSYDLLKGDADKPIKLGLVERDGAKRELELRRTGWDNGPNDPTYEFKMLDGNIAYVKATSFGDDEPADRFAADFPEVLKANGLIFDVRLNGGGSSGVGWDMLRRVASAPFKGSAWSAPTYVGPYRAWGRKPEPVGEPGATLTPIDGTRFEKPVVVLTSGRTFSAAEDFVIVFKAMKRGVVVGMPTGGSTGQPVNIRLPGGGSARFCSKRDVGPDGEEFVGKGIAPDILVTPTAADVRDGRDTVLEKALEILRGRK